MYEVIATESPSGSSQNSVVVASCCDHLAVKGRSSEHESSIIFGQLALAVAYLHEKGIVHRDLKLENVLLDERCRVKLGDFGFTREYDRGVYMETFCGSTGYAAPEMLQGKRYLGPEVDVWSMGVILYCLLTGTLPFDDDDEAVMKDKVIQGKSEDPEWLSTVLLGVNNVPASPSHARDTFILPVKSVVSTQTQVNDLSISPATSTTSESFVSASSHLSPPVPTTPDDTPKGPFDTQGNDSMTRQPDTVIEEEPESENVVPFSAGSTTNLDQTPKAPPYPTRTPARTKRRSVSSTLSDSGSPTLDKPLAPLPPQDFASLLSTPAPIIFSTPVERDLLNSLSLLGFDTSQIVLYGGMDWVDGGAVTSSERAKDNALVEPYLPKSRPALLGIGAKEQRVLDDGSKKKKRRGDEKRYIPLVRQESSREESRNGSATVSRRALQSPERRSRGESSRRDDREQMIAIGDETMTVTIGEQETGMTEEKETIVEGTATGTGMWTDGTEIAMPINIVTGSGTTTTAIDVETGIELGRADGEEGTSEINHAGMGTITDFQKH
ncbi:hypothetical protein DEU56DRAFT_982742 [Suillus clintonianus]|uniref:uncharacterized protein n=1 Tax=Suillus clintonianus TaxID=1904413 RepID=UPI001B864C98|nr:uncharacterized protein DEU56DRAFT_982742 [Suillus clintonianus]KAG2127201.1 hypothetical protein DEU56DRAFT_982742 [Suillus clintonianus]